MDAWPSILMPILAIEAVSITCIDDLTGSLRADGIAYVIDNDGDPGMYGFGPMSPRRTDGGEIP